jgi:phospholipid N-methyltransferase/DNA-binding Xre family transcriptional regulator
MLQHTSSKIEQLRTRGTVAPSSKHLVLKMLNKLDFSKDMDLLQLGFGTGVFTAEALQQLSPDSRVTVFEVDPRSRAYLIEDERITYVEASAERISYHFPDKKFDNIISTLPFASLPRQVSQNIFSQIRAHLARHGKLLQFQYSLYSLDDCRSIFDMEPDIDFELRNIPPAFIYEVRNEEVTVRVRLERLIKDRGLSLQEVAQKSGLGTAQLNILMSNSAKALNFQTLDRLCRALNCQVGEILSVEH